MGSFAILLVFLLSVHFVTSARTSLVTQYNVSLDRWYSGTVTADSSITFTFNYRVPQNVTRALRLQVVSQNATSTLPLLVVVRESRRVTSWEIPFYLEKTYPYWSVRRTLCPAKDFLDYLLGAVGNGTAPEDQQLSVDITTQSLQPLEYSFNIWFVPGYVLQTEKTIDFRISPSSPAIFQYQMPAGIDRVLVRAWSPEKEKICSYLSVQPAYCPVADLPGEITSQGEYQTFTTQGAILVKREDFQNGKFDVVLVALSKDYRCKEMMDLTPQLQKDNIDIAMAVQRNLSGEWDDTTLFKQRQKHVFLAIEKVLTPVQYAVATLSVLAFYFLFYVAFRVALCFGYMTTKTVNVPERDTPLQSPEGDEDVEAGLKTLGGGGKGDGRSHVAFKDEDKSYGKVSEDRDKTTADNAVHDGLEMTDVLPHSEQTVGNRMEQTEKEVDQSKKKKTKTKKNKNKNTNENENEKNENEKNENEKNEDEKNEDEKNEDENLSENENEEEETLSENFSEAEEKIRQRASLAGKAVVTVTEISLRPMVQIGKRDRAYNWTLLIIAVFYALPVVQLVLTYQRVMESTGNMDLCYYNFKCAHPLGRLNDFNHIYSNIGYVLLGCLFVLIVWKRQNAHFIHERKANENDDETSLGLPPQYGLFYAMGFSLIMEGIMSACYHICPNYSNFQFDTSFMYLLGGLFLLKMYQSRHADISPNAQLAYAVFAFWIFLAVVGVVIDKQWFWTAFAVVLIIASIPLGIQMYYMGSWKFDFSMLTRCFTLLRGKHMGCSRPTAADRFSLLMMIYAVNWLMAVGGAIFAPTDFSTFLLSIVLANAFLYFVFYIFMKIRSGESIPKISQFFMVLAGGMWAGAMYFFLFRLTNWVDTPAYSREGNEHCFFLDFYDQHDVWHMMSACSMFFNFMILFTLDDDLFCVPRKDIRVF